MIRIKKQVSKRDIVILSTFSLIMFDISVILDISFLKPILGFILIFYLPGFLLLLQWKRLTLTLDLALLSFPFSVAIMEILLYSANSVFGLLQVQFFNKLVLLLTLHGYYLVMFILVIKYLKDNIKFEFLLNRDVLIICTLCISILMFSGYSRWYFNNTNNNYFLWIFLLILIIMLVFGTFYGLQRNFFEVSYLLILYSISLSIYFSYSGISSYPLGIDVHKEIYTTSRFIASTRWGMDVVFSVIASTLFVSLILPVYAKLVDISALFIYKYVYFVIISIIPLILFRAYCKILEIALDKEKYNTIKTFAFISSIVYVLEFGYIYTLSSALRQGAAFLILTGIMYIFISLKFNLSPMDWIYLTLLIIGVVLSHYSTAYIFAIATLISGIFGLLISRGGELRRLYLNFLNMGFLSAILSYLWYWMINKTSYSVQSFIKFFVNALIFGIYSKSPAVSKTISIFSMPLPLKVIVITNLAILGLILLGYLHLVYTVIMKSKINYIPKDLTSYLLLTAPYILLVIFAVVAPYLSVGYDIDRIYQQGLILGAPLFILGYCLVLNILSRISKATKMSRQVVIIAFLSSLVLSSQVFSVTYTWYDLLGQTYSEFLSSNTSRSNVLVVTSPEIMGINYLLKNSPNYSPIVIYGDTRADIRIYEALANNVRDFHNLLLNTITCGELNTGYYYLRESNVRLRTLLLSREFDKETPLGECILFENPKVNIIYDSNSSIILLR